MMKIQPELVRNYKQSRTRTQSSDLRGTKLNPKLVVWDYGKEINLNLEDALISMESLRLMMGGNIVKAATGNKVAIRRSEQAKVVTDNTLPKLYDHLTKNELTAPTSYRYINLSTGERGRVTDGGADTFKAKKDEIVRVMWEDEKDGSENNGAVEITISPNTFAGTLGQQSMRA